ncbi:MAG: transketolase [Synergistaceae bacterium]|nr:transketolase [Synergistaceae bacterium]
MSSGFMNSLKGCREALAELDGVRRDTVILDCGCDNQGNGKSLAAADAVLRSAGLALGGKRVFLRSENDTSYIARAYEQIRAAVCIPNLRVVFLSAHDGAPQSKAGASRQMKEDFALMRALPGMAVLVPSDYRSAYTLTGLLSSSDGPAYMRVSHYETADIYRDDDSDFSIGGARLLREGDGVTICAAGTMVVEALAAGESLASQGISADVIDCYSIKPFPGQTLLASVRRTGCCVVAEHHAGTGGLFGAVAECLSLGYPAPARCVSLEDRFGQSGAEDELREYYGLTRREIEHNALQVWAIRRR